VTEVNKLVDSPKCFITNNLKLTTVEEKCVDKYTDSFLKSLAQTVKTAIDNDWKVNVDVDDEGATAKGKPPKSISYTVKYDWDDKVTSVDVTKIF
jgi:hypothetical protein